MIGTSELAAACDGIEKLSREFDAGWLAPHEATEAMRLGAAIEAMGASIKARSAVRVAQSRMWEGEGHASAAHWFAAASGTTVGQARDQLDTQARLDALPEVRDAAERGALSVQQTAAIADAAAVDPAAEAALLEAASASSLTGLRDECRRRKAAADPDPDGTYARIRAERSVRAWTDADGARNLLVRGPADVVAGIEGHINATADQIFKTACAEGRREPRAAYQFDALHALIADRAPTSTSTSRKRANNPAHLTLVRVDLAALVNGRVDDGEVCEIAGIGPLPATRVRDLLGESIVKLVVTNGVDVANITHLGRGPTAAQLLATLWRSPTCIIAGCDRTDIEFDHHHDWAHTHTTRADNLGGLCHHHHDLKSRGAKLIRHPDDTAHLEPP